MLTGIITAKDFRDSNGNSMLTASKDKIKGSSIEVGTVVAGSVDADWVYAGNIEAGQISGGVANLRESINIGNVGSTTQQKTINFINSGGNDVTLGYNGSSFYINSTSRPTSIWGYGISLSSSNNLNLQASNGEVLIWGDSIRFSSSDISGLRWSDLSGNPFGSSDPNDFADKVHSHDEYASAGHTHGNSYVKSKWGQNLSWAYEESTNSVYLRWNDKIVGSISLS
jgi:hypothetical protein